MIRKVFFCLATIGCFGKSFGMAGYEIFSHFDGQQIAQIENQSVVSYNYQLINFYHINAQDNSSFFRVHLLNGNWIEIPLLDIPEHLTLRQAIEMVESRVILVPVADELLQKINIIQEQAGNNERNQNIFQRALVTPLSQEIPVQGNQPFKNSINILKQALMNGGYNTYIAAVLYYLKVFDIIDNFAELPLDQINYVVLHIKVPVRVSKNMRELSLNSLNLTNEEDFYNSLKNKLNFFGILPSTTIVSYSVYQD